MLKVLGRTLPWMAKKLNPVVAAVQKIYSEAKIVLFEISLTSVRY